ncbi:MAG: hypothetical protein M1829_005075 [Trizodia sp. TS-e1964]|nr:MAG: hypothetical protein M1829_005075 [Trizodia sp. TS-e1964]
METETSGLSATPWEFSVRLTQRTLTSMPTSFLILPLPIPARELDGIQSQQLPKQRGVQRQEPNQEGLESLRQGGDSLETCQAVTLCSDTTYNFVVPRFQKTLPAFA